MEHILSILAILLALAFAFINGFHDGFNVIANSVLSRSISPRNAMLLACSATAAAPFIFGSAVAATIGNEIIVPGSLGDLGKISPMLLVLSSLISAIIWCLMTWWVGMPPSSSHALLGGLIGSGVAAYGLEIVNWSVLFFKALLFLFFSPLIGILLAILAMHLAAFFSRKGGEAMGKFLGRTQWISLVFLSAGHGTNNAQKAMGIITMILLIAGTIKSFAVPVWVVLGCALSLALGVSTGGWKLLSILGGRAFKIEPIHAFNSQLTSGIVLFLAGLIGTPISTTQIVKSTIIGVGAGHRNRPVRMMLFKDLITAWVLTMPASALLSATIFWIVSGILGQGMGSFGSIMKMFGQ